MRLRYASTEVAAIAFARLFETLAAKAATAMLAASRLRSAVKSTPGKVSSKSLMSNRMFCSGGGEGPEVHQMAIAAGLDRDSGGGLVAEILGHHNGSAA